MEKSFNRKALLQGVAVLAGAHILSGCGAEEMSQMSLPTQKETEAINDSANAAQQAVRGEQIQINPPPTPPQSKTWKDGQFIKSVMLDYNGLALNYDDGPSPYNTDPILRTLAKYGIKGTFFLIGVNAIAWPEIVVRIRDEGHEIGNHSHTHNPYSALPLANQIPINQQIIYDIAGLYPVANRAPGLTRGQVILDMCKRLGMYEVHTTIDSLDWRSPRIPSGSIINNVLNPLHPGAFPLQHDGGSRRPTTDAQEAIILGALARGYKFDTVTGLLNSGTPSPGTFGYALSSLSNLVVDLFKDESQAQETLMCNYNPELELKTRLSDTSVKYPEKMRITEALLQLEESNKD